MIKFDLQKMSTGLLCGAALISGVATAAITPPDTRIELSVTPGKPLTTMNNNGTLSYTYSAASGTGVFQANLDPFTTDYPPATFVAPSPLPGGSKYVKVGVTLDSSGTVVGGVTGDDFVFFGGADTNGDYMPDVEGVLLTGEVVSFGFKDSGTSIDRFDMRIRVTGGLIASYFAGKDIGLILNPENSTFSNSFNGNFSGTFVKGTFGPIPRICVDLEKQVSVDDGATWVNADAVGDADVPSLSHAGATAKYRLIANNCASGDLTNVVVNDPVLGIYDYTIGTLTGGASVILTEGEIPALSVPGLCSSGGTKINSASIYADSASTNETVTDSDTAVVQCNTLPSVRVIKQISVDGGATWMDADTVAAAPSVFAPHGAEYRFIVENDGTSNLENVMVSDVTLGLVYTIGNMLPGEVLTLDKGTIPGAALAERCAMPGQFPNVVSVSANEVGDLGNSVTDSDAAHLVCIDDGTPGIEIVKEISIDGSIWADANNYGDADMPQTLFPSSASYRLTVRNTGDVNLVDVVVNDATLGVTDYAIGTLNVGQQVVVTQAQLPALYVATRCNNSGVFTNTASTSGTSANNAAETVSDSDNAVMECVGEPGLKIVKEITTNGTDWFDANTAADAPTEIFPSAAEYRFIVTNIGTAPLVNVVVSDAELGVSGYVVGDLALGESVVIGAGEIPALSVAERCANSGTFTNVARVDGQSAETGEADTATDPAVLVCIGKPNLTVSKQVSVDGGTTWAEANQVGDADVPTVVYPHGAEYRLVVKNTGTIGLTDIVVNDADLGIVNVAVAGTIPVGGELVIESGDIAALSVVERCSGSGEIINVASVAAAAVDTGATVSASDSAVMECVGTPHITLLKQVSLDGSNWADADAAGNADVPHAVAPSGAEYRFIVRNDGSSPLTNVVINDAELGIANYAVGDLAIGQQVTIGSGELSALAVAVRCAAKGTFTNVADVSGESTETGASVSDSDPAVMVCEPPVVGVCEVNVDLTATYSDTPVPTECGECDGKITTLTLRYNGTSAAHIVVKQRKGGTVFSGSVEPNSTFSFVGTDSKGTLGTEIAIYVDGSLATKIHTSCSQAVNPGMDFGPFTVIEGASRNGGALCPVGGTAPTTCDDVTFTYTLTNSGDPVDVLLEDDTYELGLGMLQMGTGESQQFVNQVCVSSESTNTATVTASLVGNGTITCGDSASVTVYCAEQEVWVQHCTNSSSGGQECSLVKEMQMVCGDVPPPPVCEDEEVWVQHCTNSSSGGQECSLVKEMHNTCDEPTPPPPACEDETVWVQHCTNSSSGGQECSLVEEVHNTCDEPTPPPPACEDETVWVQHCTNSSSGGQECSLVEEVHNTCDEPTPPPPACEDETVWVQHCTNSSSGGQECSLVEEVHNTCDEPTPPPPACEDETVWVQHCTSSSSGGQECSLVEETTNSCDENSNSSSKDSEKKSKKGSDKKSKKGSDKKQYKASDRKA